MRSVVGLDTFSIEASSRACILSGELSQTRQENDTEARRLKTIFGEHEMTGFDNEDGERQTITLHCENKLKLCTSIRHELELARKILDEHGITDQEVDESNTALEAVVAEELVLRQQLPRLVAMILAASHQVLSEAYSQTLSDFLKEKLPSPRADEDVWIPKREENDQLYFRQALLRRYRPLERLRRSPQDTRNVICPITDTGYYPDHMRAAHLVPAALGELNCAYLFGRPVEDGWQILFNPNNGLLLNKEIQKAFDRAVLQVVPDLTAENQGFQVAYLGDQVADELHERDVEFRKGVKGPGIENLFIAALLAAFRRKRYDCPGWWEDYRKLFYEPKWPDTPLHLRERVLHVLAAMYGDSERFEELINRGTVRFQTISGTADQDETTALSLTATTPPPYKYKYTWTKRDDWEGEKDWYGEKETLEDTIGHLTFERYTAQQHIIELTKLYRKKDEESASMKGKYERQIAELKQKIEEQKKWLAD